MMKAAVCNDFGGLDVFQVTEVPKPTSVGAHEVLVKVLCVSVNPVDFKMRKNNWWSGKAPFILGYDVSGVVEAVGVGCKRIKVGDDVFYSADLFGCNGANSEYHVVRETIVVTKPVNLTFPEAASLPLAGCTAFEAIILRLEVKIGQTVLIHAGAGGVGSLAIQITKAAGARVITTCSEANVEFVTGLGADIVINYKKQDYVEVCNTATNGLGVDCVLDTVGGDTVARSTKCTAKGGKLATIASVSDLGSLIFKNQTLMGVFMERTLEKMLGVQDLASRGLLKPHVHTLLEGLEAIRDSHEMLEKGGIKGKIVVQIAKE